MSERSALGDDELRTLFADVMALDVPQYERLNASGANAWEWRNVNEQLGELIEDSLTTTGDVRVFESDERAMTWEWPGVTLELLVVSGHEVVDVHASVSGDTATDITVQSIVGEHLHEQSPEMMDSTFSFRTAAGRLTQIGVLLSTGTSKKVSTGWFRV
jgi:hypothetical protein